MDDGPHALGDLAHVSDVGRGGFVASLGNTRAAGNDYHLTSHEHTDWNGVYRALAEAAGATAEIVYVPSEWLRKVAPRAQPGRLVHLPLSRRCTTTPRPRRDLCFRTVVPLVETFRRQIRWMEETGKLRGVDEEPCEDCLVGALGAPGKDRIDDPRWVDENPWGNNTEN